MLVGVLDSADTSTLHVFVAHGAGSSEQANDSK
jgi:hypothetical protein